MARVSPPPHAHRGSGRDRREPRLTYERTAVLCVASQTAGWHFPPGCSRRREVNVQVNQSTPQRRASTDADGRGDAISSIQSPADTQRDHRERMIEELTFSMRATERLRDSYRELLLLALTQIHDLSVKNRALKASVWHLLERMRRDVVEADRGDVA
jgi:hypothetical protein